MSLDVLSVVKLTICNKKSQKKFRRLVHVVINNMTCKQQRNNPNHVLTFYHRLHHFDIISLAWSEIDRKN